jgi:hypothetical protein
MDRNLGCAFLLAGRGVALLLLALVDWLTARANASERPYLIPFKVAGVFLVAINSAWHGQNGQPSLLACTNWSRSSCGPSPGESTRSFI